MFEDRNAVHASDSTIGGHRSPAETASVSRLAFGFSFLLPILLLAPFAGKAFHIDDTLYLWAAKQIQVEPLNYYNTVVNEWGIDQPLYEVMVNPPGFPYFLALVAFLFGWGELPFHLAIALTAGLYGGGTYLLACRFCARPILATLLAVFTPAFLISSTTVMTDMPMAALYVWAVLLWVLASDRKRSSLYIASMLCLSLSMLVKYSGFTAVPLLLAYSLIKERKLGAWAFYLLAPVVVLLAYQIVEYQLYGRAQLLFSLDYAKDARVEPIVAIWLKPHIAMAFAGGCIASAVLLAPALWSRRVLIGMAAAVGAITLAGYPFAETLLYTTRISPSVTWLLSAQNAIFIVGGTQIVAFTWLDLWRNRNSDSALLVFWVLGTIAFALLINWSINARTLLPMAAPVAILAVRRLRHSSGEFGVGRQRWICAGAVSSAAMLSLMLTWVDFRQANIARIAAEKFIEDDRQYPFHYYFESHWGFQYYMEQAGVPYLDDTRLRERDRIVAPLWGSVDPDYNPAMARRVPNAGFTMQNVPWLATMHPALCAGFYSHTRGPLPFAFGPVPPEQYVVYQLGRYGQR